MAPKPPLPEHMAKTVEKVSQGEWKLLESTWKGKGHFYHCECRTHGPFSQSWSSLRLGYGCRICGQARQIESVTNYTAQEDSFIIANHHLSAEEIGKRLNRPAKGIAKRREKLPVPKKTRADSGRTKVQTTQRKGEEQRELLRGFVEEKLFDYPASPTIALEQGAKYYFAGNACARGHYSPYFASNRSCVECTLEDSGAKAGTEARKTYIREYNKRPHVAEKRRASSRLRYSENDNYRMRAVITSRINTALRRAKAAKTFSTIEYIGLPHEEYMEWLEANLKEGMDWNNYGNKALAD